MAEDVKEQEFPEVNPKWLRCLDENKNSGIYLIESLFSKIYIKEVITISPWTDFNTGIKHSCLFFIQNATRTWEMVGAIMYGSTDGVELNSGSYAGFFNSGKNIDARRYSTPGDIMIKNNTGSDITVFYFALKLFD